MKEMGGVPSGPRNCSEAPRPLTCSVCGLEDSWGGYHGDGWECDGPVSEARWAVLCWGSGLSLSVERELSRRPLAGERVHMYVCVWVVAIITSESIPDLN